MTRYALAGLAVVALCGFALAEDPKFPSLDAKEWKKLDNGMKVWTVEEGKGDECPAGAKVTMHYTGWTTDGKKFDSSRGDKPLTSPLKGLIKGWQQGVPGMKPGGKRYLMIPPELAYGQKGSPPDIGANATLIFEIEMVSFEK